MPSSSSQLVSKKKILRPPLPLDCPPLLARHRRHPFPSDISPTMGNRTWFVNPFGGDEKIAGYIPFTSLIPAALGTILVFMDQQITGMLPPPFLTTFARLWSASMVPCCRSPVPVIFPLTRNVLVPIHHSPPQKKKITHTPAFFIHRGRQG